jgi:hypothetical protein
MLERRGFKNPRDVHLSKDALIVLLDAPNGKTMTLRHALDECRRIGHREAIARWRQRHPERARSSNRAAGRKWRAAHREEHRATMREVMRKRRAKKEAR